MNPFSRIFRRNGLTCDQVAAVMQQYLDSELDPDQVPKVIKHLDKCRDCGLEADTYRRIKASLNAYQQQPDQASLQRLRDVAQGLIANGAPDE